MIKGDEYIDFRDRSKAHMRSTLAAFEFWGNRVGRINGQIKDKWGEARWYAELGAPSSLYEIVHVNQYPFRDEYKWDPTTSRVNKFLDVLNNSSKLLFFLLYIFALHKLFFYNVAYWVAIAKNPKCASDIVWAAHHPKKIIFGKWFALLIHKLNSKK